MVALRWLVMVVGLLLTTVSAVDASCVCKDLDECGSHPDCLDKVPGLDCSPPTNGTCHVSKGRPFDLACCCGCSRRNGATVAACTTKYAVIGLALQAIKDGPEPGVCVAALVGRGSTPAPNPVQPVVDRTLRGTERRLNGARQGCEREKPKQENQQERGAHNDAQRLRDKLRKAERRGRIGEGCADAYGKLIDDFLQSDGTGSTTSTTTSTSTSTTMPAGPVVVSTGFGPFPAGTKICLERFGATKCLTDGGACGALHVHSLTGFMDISGAQGGPFGDPQTTGVHCGYGVVQPEEPGCHTLPDFPPECP